MYFRWIVFFVSLHCFMSACGPVSEGAKETETPAQDSLAPKVLKDMQEFYFESEKTFKTKADGDKIYAEVFNTKEQLVTVRNFRDGKVTTGIKYVYNSKGQVIEEQSFVGRQGVLKRSKLLEYNEAGDVVREKFMQVKNGNYLPTAEISKTYNEQQQLIELIEADYSEATGDMEPKMGETFEYDELGRVKKVGKESKANFGQGVKVLLKEIKMYAYEEGKEEVTTNTVFDDFEQPENLYTDLKTFTASGELERIVSKRKGEVIAIRTHRYDEADNLIETLIEYPQRKKQEKKVYTYDASGRKLSTANYEEVDSVLTFKSGSHFLYHFH
ncbi:MAG: hypothetical protein ACFB10_04090 [Salibacteraceae bacterium]